MKSRAKHSGILERSYRDAQARTASLRAHTGASPLSEPDEQLLLLAERKVRRMVRWRKTVPLNLILLLPGLLFVQTSSSVVLAGFVAGFPLLLLARAFLSRALSGRLGPEEILVRRAYHDLVKPQARDPDEAE